jgi:two-component system LytT family response regulator
MSLTVSRPIGDVTKEYDATFFYRVHKSFLVNCKMISGIVKDDLIHLTLENGVNIPVAKRRTHDFLSFLEKIR